MIIENEGYFNIIWFARDLYGNIIAAQSLESEIPGFVKRDAEKTAAISDKLAGLKAIGRDGDNPIEKELLASRCGFYCYSANDPYRSIYKLTAVPQNPVNIKDMPDSIIELLSDNVVPFEAATTPSFEIADGAFL